MGCCLEKLSEEDEKVKKIPKPEITLIPPSDDEATDDRGEISLSPEQGERVVALFNYESRNAGDLSFLKSEEFHVLKATESAWWNVMRLDNGDKGYVPSNFVCFADSLQSERWFFGTITRKDSERLLLQMKTKGSFLIRESETSENSFSLSLLNESGSDGLYVKHYRIRYNNESFLITEGVEFSKLSSLVSFYQDAAHGLCCQLTKPCDYRDVPQTLSLGPHATVINEDEIELMEKITSTSQSVTRRGVWNDSVMLAVTEYDSSTLSTTLIQIEEMRQIHHKSVVKFFGNISHKPTTMCWEYLNGGNLSDYLKKAKTELPLTDVIDIAAQVATGMAYLETIPFAHRYLRARYVAIQEGPIFKVAEYGTNLAPKKIDSDAHQWLSFESLEQDTYDIKSDVWSYGVLIVEALKCGDIPYPDGGISEYELLEKLRSGYRIPKIDKWPSALYELLIQCWEMEPTSRPTFEYIQIFMENYFHQNNAANST